MWARITAWNSDKCLEFGRNRSWQSREAQGSAFWQGQEHRHRGEGRRVVSNFKLYSVAGTFVACGEC